MMEKPFVLVGAAHWHAPWHRDALLKAGCRIVAVSDPDSGATARLADRHGLAQYADWRAMLAAHPEAIGFVLTPPDEAPEVLAALVSAGMPIVLEKPGTVDAAALAPMASAAQRIGLPTAVPLVNRLMSFWSELARHDPAFSRWTHAHFRILAGPPQRYISDGVPWVLSQARYGGGALRNLGIHAADAALTIAAGAPLRLCSAMISNRLHRLEVDDFAAATLATDDGRTITIEAGYCMPTEASADKQWRIHGPGWAITEDRGMLTLRTVDGMAQRASASSARQYDDFGAVMTRMARGAPPAMASLADLLAAQQLVDRIYQAASGAGQEPF